jgi:hypothetical protein
MGKYKDIDLTNKQKKLVAGDYANLQSNKSKGNVISTIRTIDMGKILGAFPFVSGSTRTKNNAKGGMMKKKKFPDLSGDGKVTKKDILMARGVIKKKKSKKKAKK